MIDNDPHLFSEHDNSYSYATLVGKVVNTIQQFDWALHSFYNTKVASET